jgi:hypothetical protein
MYSLKWYQHQDHSVVTFCLNVSGIYTMKDIGYRKTGYIPQWHWGGHSCQDGMGLSCVENSLSSGVDVWHRCRLYYKYCWFLEVQCHCAEAYHYRGACWSVTWLLALPVSLSLTSGKKYCIMCFFPLWWRGSVWNGSPIQPDTHNCMRRLSHLVTTSFTPPYRKLHFYMIVLQFCWSIAYVVLCLCSFCTDPERAPWSRSTVAGKRVWSHPKLHHVPQSVCCWCSEAIPLLPFVWVYLVLS